MASLDDSVERASMDFISQSAARLGVHTNAYPYLAAHSPLHERANQLVEAAARCAPAVSCTDLGEYIALAAVINLLEGWRFISKAAYALLQGSLSASVHLSYYAELRAARSLLASNGFYVGNRTHLALDKDGNVIPVDCINSPPALTIWQQWIEALRTRLTPFVMRSFPKLWHRYENLGTHVVCWKAMAYWAAKASTGALLLDCLPALSYQGINWHNVCSSTAGRTDIPGAWLQNWSIDLKKISTDIDARHSASYGINLSPDAFGPLRESDCDLIWQANDSCLSLDGGGVDSIDLVLLFDFCMKAIGPTLPSKVGKNDGRVWNLVKNWLMGTGGWDESIADETIKQIRKASKSSAGKLMNKARIENKGADGVFARAFLLLRLATDVNRHLWKQARTFATGGSLAWQDMLLKDFAYHANLGSAAKLLPPFADLESDIEVAVTDWETWKKAGGAFSGFRAWTEQANALLSLCRFEKIALKEMEL